MQQSSHARQRFLGLILAVVVTICSTESSTFAQAGLFSSDSETPLVSFTQEIQPLPPSKSADSSDKTLPPPPPPERPRPRSRNYRLTDSVTRAPAMMGDFFGGGIPFSYVGLSGSLPVGSRRSKIAEMAKLCRWIGSFSITTTMPTRFPRLPASMSINTRSVLRKLFSTAFGRRK